MAGHPRGHKVQCPGGPKILRFDISRIPRLDNAGIPILYPEGPEAGHSKILRFDISRIPKLDNTGIPTLGIPGDPEIC